VQDHRSAAGLRDRAHDRQPQPTAGPGAGGAGRRERVGDPLDKAVDIGALVAQVQVERVRDLVKKGVAEGGELYEPDIDLPKGGGCFLRPMLITDVSPANTVVSEEIFGPVLVEMSFRTPDEAVELANNTRYGLAATLWSENVNLALDIAPRLKAGVVWINGTNQFDAAVGFGGYRESGFGREGGRSGLAAYLDTDDEPVREV